MIPSTAQIIEKRHACCRRLRYTAVYLLITSTIFLSYWVLHTLLSRELYWSSGVLSFGLAFIVPSVPIWLFDRRLARLIVPMPRSVCPGCGYSFEGLTTTRCPECGIAVPKVFVHSMGEASA